MGHLIKERIFVSDLSAAEIADARKRTLWLAARHFSNQYIESFDLGNFIGGYMTVEITTSYAPYQHRIWYYLDNRLVYTERVQVGKSAHQKAQDYYRAQIDRQHEKSRARTIGVHV